MTARIDKAKATQEYRNGDPKTKTALENIFGAKFFHPLTDRIRSFSDACAVLGLEPSEVVPHVNPTTSEKRAVNAYAKLLIIAKALQEDWEADYTDRNQAKWWCWFEFKAGVGFVVGDTVYGHSYSGTDVGSRLCMPTAELARYFGEQFIDLHREMLQK